MEYENEPLIYIMEPFIELLSQEFKTSTISQDGNVDDDSFYIHSLLAEKEDMRDCGDISVYTMTIIREIASIKKGKDIFKRLSRDAARLDRLQPRKLGTGTRGSGELGKRPHPTRFPVSPFVRLPVLMTGRIRDRISSEGVGCRRTPCVGHS